MSGRVTRSRPRGLTGRRHQAVDGGAVAGLDVYPEAAAVTDPGSVEAERRRVRRAVFVSVIAAPALELLALVGASLVVEPPLELAVYYTLAVMLVTWAAGSFRPRINPHISDDAPVILSRLGLPLLVAPIVFHSAQDLGALVQLAALSAVTVVTACALSNLIVRAMRRKPDRGADAHRRRRHPRRADREDAA